MKQDDLLVGIHAVESALNHDVGNIIELLVEQGVQNKRVKDVLEQAKMKGVAVHARPREFLDSATGGTRHQGLIARYRKPADRSESELSDLIEQTGQSVLILVLDGVQDPHNLGACLRSAAAAGVTAVVIPKDKAVSVTPTVRTASAGARTLEHIKTMGVWVTGMAGDAKQSLYAIDLKGPLAVVVGGESDGMRRLTRDRCDYLAHIPMPGVMESLNVSVATGIALFEIVRQRSAEKA
jgi:23S rRNA (guanosine2251-2'-O)-methyltransferase